MIIFLWKYGLKILCRVKPKTLFVCHRTICQIGLTDMTCLPMFFLPFLYPIPSPSTKMTYNVLGIHMKLWTKYHLNLFMKNTIKMPLRNIPSNIRSFFITTFLCFSMDNFLLIFKISFQDKICL